MPKEVDLNELLKMSAGQPVNQSKASEISENICDRLNQLFDLILNSSKDVLGNITSLGIRYGSSFDAPDHMLVIFPNEVFGFQNWNSQKRCFWRYQKTSQAITQNGRTVPQNNAQTFVDFIQIGLDAINTQNVVFSKDITREELKKAVA